MADADNDGLLDVVTLSADGVRVARQVAGGAFEDVTARTGLTNTDVAAAAVAKSESRVPESRRSVPARRRPVRCHGHPGRTRRQRDAACGQGRRASAFHVALTGQVSNRSGVGAKVEIRAGSLWQKLETSAASPAAAPADLLFGLGARATVDVVRVLWPAGIVQAEPIGAETQKARTLDVVELDRKPSSCPYLYTWNGERFEFVTDFLGGGEMGYQVSPGAYSTPDPEEFVRIRGDQLRARNGRLELRVTNELEETLFLDHLSLVAVDHPVGTDVFPREGLVSTPAAGLHLETAARPPGSRASHRCRRTGRHRQRPHAPIASSWTACRCCRCAATRRPHAITVDLGAGTPARDALLLLTGWTDYAFSSDNIAASQAGYALHPPSLQVRDARGDWQTVIEEIGVPVGRPQTIVVDLTDRFLSESREVRITTSMRVYWDQVEVATRAATARPPRRSRRARLPVGADLRWRGFSEVTSPAEPLTFDYDRVDATSPWKQMPGRYTREGDVRDLLREVGRPVRRRRARAIEVALAFEARRCRPFREAGRERSCCTATATARRWTSTRPVPIRPGRCPRTA